MERILTPEQMRALEQAYMVQTGTPSIELMERAARAVARMAMELSIGPGRTAVFACGPGGNGGDGFAAARLYAEAGGRALVLPITGEDRMRGDALQNRERALRCAGVAFLSAEALDRLETPALWVDALFGIGFSRALDPLCARIARRMERDRGLGARVLAVDIPSGLNGLTGQADPNAVRATHTITFECRKAGHALGAGFDLSGELRVASIGIPGDMLPPDALRHATPQKARAALPARPRDSHKGTFGHLLVIAGSRGMAGAALLCANAALRSGAGLVSVACPESLLSIIQTGAPCAMALPLPERDGALSEEAAPLLREAFSGKRALAIGPGLSTRAHPSVVAEALSSGLPAVIDADALNLIAQNPPLKAMLSPIHLITPHPGEAARLLDARPDGPLMAARALRALGPVALYKGTGSVIWGENVYLRTAGCSGMAKGGSGDVLTGMLGALLARGIPTEQAAWIGAALHGEAGEIAGQRLGPTAMTAGDIIDCLKDVWGDA